MAQFTDRWHLRDLPRVKVEVLGNCWMRVGTRRKEQAVLYRSAHDGEVTARGASEFARLFVKDV